MYKTTVRIEGMMCTMCESHINETIRKAFPSAKKVKSSHKKNETVFISEKEIDTGLLRDAIENTGYHFIEAECLPYEKKGLFG